MPALSSRLAVAMVTALIALPAAAADPAVGWPTSMPPGWGTRGSGGGLAILPAVLPWIVILAWMRSVDWVSRDATRHKITPAFWGTACGLPLRISKGVNDARTESRKLPLNSRRQSPPQRLRSRT